MILLEFHCRQLFCVLQNNVYSIEFTALFVIKSVLMMNEIA